MMIVPREARHNHLLVFDMHQLKTKQNSRIWKAARSAAFHIRVLYPNILADNYT
jgi:hypothetical protein